MLVDFEKAFDKVESEVLIKKLSNCRIRSTELKGFFSYLSNRRQCCKDNGRLSSIKHIRCGAPQELYLCLDLSCFFSA